MKRPKTPGGNVIRRRALLAGLTLSASFPAAWAADAPGEVKLAYIRWMERRPTISLQDQQAPDDGLAGATLAVDDDNTTGRFMNQQFTLIDLKLRADADPLAALSAAAEQGATLVMTDAPAAVVLKLADAGRSGATVFNIAAPDDRLRGEDCRSNLIHVAPSRDMLADALTQYLVWKKWPRWLLVVGSHPEDIALGDAYRRAAKRFGARIVEERTYKDTGGSRETDSGIAETQQQMPVFTQNARDYDVVVAADENQVFAGYLPYRTWDARPVAGSAGLEPVTWDASSESWGGTQLQSRFQRRFRRRMTPLDMQAWTAARMVGEAASRTSSVDPRAIVAYIKGPDFGIAAYKGQKLSLRAWDLQLRQPILLADGRSVVSISPQPGFLHQVTELDTLGIDQPETKCKLP
jgi:ABC transporter substrate binding protein (PQQ-dependent alcohol dehydrogenase system)